MMLISELEVAHTRDSSTLFPSPVKLHTFKPQRPMGPNGKLGVLVSSDEYAGDAKMDSPGDLIQRPHRLHLLGAIFD
jgi:hypothetical protein